MREQRMSEILTMGTAISFCTTVSIVLGAFLQNVVLCMLTGAGTGVVIGAILVVKESQSK
jgi:hypothetical protein